jgi:hypothetical protein
VADTFNRTGVVNDSDPAIGAVAISYGSGNQDLSGYRVRGFHVDTAGALKVDMANGTTVTFATLTAGAFYPYAITKIYQTGSAAAGFVLV